MKRTQSHYDLLRPILKDFMIKAGIREDRIYVDGVLSAHGDKCYCFRESWEDAGIPFHKGVAIYLLSYYRPYSEQVRETSEGWVDPCQWVIDSYDKFKRPAGTLLRGVRHLSYNYVDNLILWLDTYLANKDINLKDEEMLTRIKEELLAQRDGYDRLRRKLESLRNDINEELW